MKKNVRNGKLLPFLNIFLPVVIKEETTPEEMAKQINDELELIKKDGLTPEREASLKKILEDSTVEKMNVAIEKIKGELQVEAKAELGKLEEIVKTQGEEIAKRQSQDEASGLGVAKTVEEQLKDLFKNVGEAANQNKSELKIEVKAAEYADNAIMVNTHNSITGAIGAIGTYFAQFIPGFIARKPVPKSTILDEVTVLPLNSDRLTSISQTETVTISVTAEGQVKPVSNVVWAAIDAAAKVVATLFKTSWQMRRFYPSFVRAFIDTLSDYFEKKIPQLILAEIRTYATPFTAVAAQQIYVAPNNYDALLAMIAAQIKLGYAPNSARMSVFAWEAMMSQKATDGHYMLQNNGSINLLENTISFGDVKVKIHPDLEFGDDEVFVGDLSKVYVALDSQTFYTEFIEGTDGSFNLLTHRIEKMIAINIPVATRTGLTIDTFTNVKAAITKPA